MEQYQQLDPFKFLIYAELAGAEIGRVPVCDHVPGGTTFRAATEEEA
jgi:hypothetical protein